MLLSYTRLYFGIALGSILYNVQFRAMVRLIFYRYVKQPWQQADNHLVMYIRVPRRDPEVWNGEYPGERGTRVWVTLWYSNKVAIYRSELYLTKTSYASSVSGLALWDIGNPDYWARWVFLSHRTQHYFPSQKITKMTKKGYKAYLLRFFQSHTYFLPSQNTASHANIREIKSERCCFGSLLS